METSGGSTADRARLGRRGNERDRAAWKRHLPPGTGLGDVDLLERRTLPCAWRRLWEARPDAVALIDLANGGKELSRGALSRQTARLAAALVRLGLVPGQRVLMSAGSSPELLLLYVAALRLGAVVVPANTAYRQRELGHIVRDCDPALAVMDDPERAGWARDASARGTSLPVIDPSAIGDLLDAGAEREPELDAARPDDLALIMYTSGTTGSPKGAMLTHTNLLAGAEMLRLAWRWSEDDGLVLALPLFHMHGLGVGLHGSLLAGARILLLPRFEPDSVLRACARPDASLLFGVPTTWVRLMDRALERPEGAAALSSLRLLVSGSAPLPAAVWQGIRDLTGRAVLERYGMTETVMSVSNPYDGERRPGAVGLPLPGVEIRIVKDGGEVAGDEVGEIHLRGPNVSGGYWNRPDATKEALDGDGWFRTGDLGWRSRDGYITIEGRATELIITGGYNVYPREVEEVLAEHPGVGEAAIAGLPSREWGEEVVAYIVPAPSGDPPSEGALAGWCRERLAGYKCPRRFTFVDRLPRNAMGKIVRSELRPEQG